MEIKNKTIALLIDFDNFNNDKYLNILFEELEEMGNVIYKGAFYANAKDTNIANKGKKYGINDFIVEPSLTSSKNAVDIRIALDTMELLNRDYIDCFCIASSDSDFAPIIKKIKQRNKVVIGAGLGKKTNEDYKKLCHRYISVDIIAEAVEEQTNGIEEQNPKKAQEETIKKQKANTEKQRLRQQLLNIIKEIFNNNEKNDKGFIQFSLLIENIYSKVPDFNPKNYGASNSKPSLFLKTI